LHLDIPAQSTPAQINQIKLKSKALTEKAVGCNAFNTIINKSGSKLSGELGTFKLNEISPKMKALIKDLPIGKPSFPSISINSIIVLMVCSRQFPKPVAMDLIQIRKQIRRNLITSQLILAARRYFRDLRRASFIEIRL
jgi:peptidyl-prolyl cis-trans isomerase SurA